MFKIIKNFLIRTWYRSHKYKIITSVDRGVKAGDYTAKVTAVRKNGKTILIDCEILK